MLRLKIASIPGPSILTLVYLKCYSGLYSKSDLNISIETTVPNISLSNKHGLLKSKLFSYGIDGKTIKWIDAFLCYRQQRVVVNGVKSGWAPVVSGVPQGTVLGPLLFSLHINDITSDIESEIRLFADDCVGYREIKNMEDTVKLQKDIDRLGSWARKWGMRFQPVKCNMMQLTNKRTSKIQASYKLEGTVLENVESIKYLGVTITKDLKWNTHISNVCTKANRTLVFFF